MSAPYAGWAGRTAPGRSVARISPIQKRYARPRRVQGDFRAPRGRTAAVGSGSYLALGMRIHNAI